MVELELVGLHSDGERITLAGPDGQRYLLLVDDAHRLERHVQASADAFAELLASL